MFQAFKWIKRNLYAAGWLFGTVSSRFSAAWMNLKVSVGSLIDHSTSMQRYAASFGAVLLLHVIVLILIVPSLHIAPSTEPREVFLTLSGPIDDHHQTPTLPKFMDPKLPEVSPPEVESKLTFAANIIQPQGASNVTTPAEAIAETHEFPAFPSTITSSTTSNTVRLKLSISETGVVDDAQVILSSGSAELDALAIAWVKMHWLYRPARRDGVPVSSTTTAMLVFHQA